MNKEKVFKNRKEAIDYLNNLMNKISMNTLIKLDKEYEANINMNISIKVE